MIYVTNVPQSQSQEYQDKGFIIGEPGRSSRYSVETLKAAGLVGIYRNETNNKS